jgi:hypothetical protein
MFKLNAIKITIVILMTTLFSACYYDNVDELHPGLGLSPCDTTVNISYLGDIQPIITSYCGISNASCHSANNTGQHVVLDNYQSVFDNSQSIVTSITPGSGVTQMPYQTGPLNSCNRKTIIAWVNHGSPNN